MAHGQYRLDFWIGGRDGDGLGHSRCLVCVGTYTAEITYWSDSDVVSPADRCIMWPPRRDNGRGRSATREEETDKHRGQMRVYECDPG